MRQSNHQWYRIHPTLTQVSFLRPDRPYRHYRSMDARAQAHRAGGELLLQSSPRRSIGLLIHTACGRGACIVNLIELVGHVGWPSELVDRIPLDPEPSDLPNNALMIFRSREPQSERWWFVVSLKLRIHQLSSRVSWHRAGVRRCSNVSERLGLDRRRGPPHGRCPVAVTVVLSFDPTGHVAFGPAWRGCGEPNIPTAIASLVCYSEVAIYLGNTLR